MSLPHLSKEKMGFSVDIYKFMAPKLKPQRLHQIAETGAEQLVKKARTMTTESSMKDAFSLYADYLNNFVCLLSSLPCRKARCFMGFCFLSRKIEPLRLGIESYRRSKVEMYEVETKGMNFQFGNSDSSSANSGFVYLCLVNLTILSKDNKEEVLEKAGKYLVAALIFGSSGELTPQGPVQEYVEAAMFYKFCVSGILYTLDEINSTLLPLSDPSLEPLQINILDYILGLADLTGELMRMAIGRISDGEVEFAQRICQFVRQIHRELLLVVPQMDDTCFSVNVRGSEYIPLLGDDAPTSFLLGARSLHLELKYTESDDCMRKLSGRRRKCQLWIRRGLVQETEISSGAIGAMLSADAATDCGLRRRMYEETSPEEMNVHMSIRTVPSFLGESDENIFEEICKSGTGKPTVIELLRKFYNPDEVITFDGFEINTFSWNGHRSNPGYDTMMLRQTVWFSIQWTGSWFTHRLSTIKNSFKNGINVEKRKKETLIDIKKWRIILLLNNS
ncbi:hypothetical protein HID58_075358 [Brassica napus]|uniref:BRO1 domain-containing protein n=1 Tax=Brassica napus TaxID=3708 RepID=A0ABQ7YJJ8_BRANA|nr:hypothetical protein HID58_075358 [Brassica napus]